MHHWDCDALYAYYESKSTEVLTCRLPASNFSLALHSPHCTSFFSRLPFTVKMSPKYVEFPAPQLGQLPCNSTCKYMQRLLQLTSSTMLPQHTQSGTRQVCCCGCSKHKRRTQLCHYSIWSNMTGLSEHEGGCMHLDHCPSKEHKLMCLCHGCRLTLRMRLSLNTKLVMLATKMKMDGKTAPHRKMIP